jgi:hypothetical protein
MFGRSNVSGVDIPSAAAAVGREKEAVLRRVSAEKTKGEFKLGSNLEIVPLSLVR